MATNKFIKTTLWLIWSGFLIAVITVFLIFYLISREKIGYIPSFAELENPQTNLATELYSSDGVLLGKYYNENRTIVQFNDLSPNLVNALLATEDIRFYKHSGIDYRALARVIVKSIFLGQSAGGGSTLSQQLAKNLYRMRDEDIVEKEGIIADTWEKALTKFQEWVTAVKLERNYTKDEIMVMYLNTVTFGHNAFGIKSAAYTFFGKTPDSLNLTEASIIVGLLKAPSKYSPILNPDNALNRRNTVFDQIKKFQHDLNRNTGWQIKPDSYFDSLQAQPIEISYHKQTHNDGVATYFREYLRLYVTASKPEWSEYSTWNKQKFFDDSTLWKDDNLYGWCNKNIKPNGEPYNVYRDGLKIYTTINYSMQQYAENAVEKHLGTGDEPLQELFEDQMKNWSHPPFDWRVSNSQIEQIMENSMKRSGRWKALAKTGMNEDDIKETFYEDAEMTVFSWKGYIDTVMTPYDSILYYKTFLRSGFVAIEPANGHIKAYVGGNDYNFFKYDAVMVARRQVGSTFKPFVYSLAMMPGGYSPCFKVQNIPYTIDVWHQGRKEAWTPQFSSSSFDDQMISLKYGLALSLNQISAWVIKQYGPQPVIDLVRNMGIKSPLEPVYSLSVGAGEVKLIEMVSAYCTYPNGGVHVSPIMVTRIEDKYGNVLASFTASKNQAMDENTAYRVIELMRGVVQLGTARRLSYKYQLTNDIAGKTGTTNDNTDGWFIGYTPSLVAGAWVGGEERSIRFSSTNYGQGASMALPIWAFFMQQVFSDPNLPYNVNETFRKPLVDDGVETDCDDYIDDDNIVPADINF